MTRTDCEHSGAVMDSMFRTILRQNINLRQELYCPSCDYPLTCVQAPHDEVAHCDGCGGWYTLTDDCKVGEEE